MNGSCLSSGLMQALTLQPSQLQAVMQKETWSLSADPVPHMQRLLKHPLHSSSFFYLCYYYCQLQTIRTLMLRVAVFFQYTPVAEGRELWKPAVTTFPSTLLITVTWIRSFPGSSSRQPCCRALQCLSSRLGCCTEESVFWLNQPLLDSS